MDRFYLRGGNQYNAWAKHALDFEMKTPTFEKMIHRVIRLVEAVLYDHYVNPLSMTQQVLKGTVFSHYPAALYATDVKF
ncbi:hypothetical protein H257_15437 [Aphanomyces astaci]|uniref:Uncharacterized protein n=1 Tax=Aphanomyces astaci TaxID=112090 RepID=W4FM91_APHAT|nr:hypothetical protein H257_15437 [Aphanomyces astaci]ETV68627.1 hypothetical protein H257_15437 [Aphanomyces astaci]|eukprot:XP_009841852.1 hypothetical protein H257_15437 [Aphanomyces astaci]